MTHYDAIVIGAGVNGSSTAYHLAKAGKKTLLFEQFPLLHNRGSSHGHSRALNRRYGLKQWYYSQMVEEAVQLWRTLEAETGQEVFRQIGQLNIFMDPKGADDLEKSYRKVGKTYRKLNNQELKAEYPQLRMPAYTVATYEKDSGLVLADKALQAFQSAFRQFNGEIRDSEGVTEIIPGSQVQVVTTKGRYTSDKLIIAAGSWAKEFLRPLGLELPITPWRVSVLYWRVTKEGEYSSDVMPMFRFPRGTDGAHVYCVPEMEYPGLVKVCLHRGVPIEPNARDEVDDSRDIELMCQFVQKYLPYADGTKPAIVERCIYSMTPDEQFILDRHPNFPNIIFGAGFSGDGFHFSPVTGNILSCMAQDKATGHDMANFRLDKYKNNNKSKL